MRGDRTQIVAAAMSARPAMAKPELVRLHDAIPRIRRNSSRRGRLSEETSPTFMDTAAPRATVGLCVALLNSICAFARSPSMGARTRCLERPWRHRVEAASEHGLGSRGAGRKEHQNGEPSNGRSPERTCGRHGERHPHFLTFLHRLLPESSDCRRGAIDALAVRRPSGTIRYELAAADQAPGRRAQDPRVLSGLATRHQS
jgi:hypothetical protein